jgi:hypothetical protein
VAEAGNGPHHRPDHAAALLLSVEPGWQAALVHENAHVINTTFVTV